MYNNAAKNNPIIGGAKQATKDLATVVAGFAVMLGISFALVLILMALFGTDHLHGSDTYCSGAHYYDSSCDEPIEEYEHDTYIY